MRLKNMIISDNGVNTLVYCLTLTQGELAKWYEFVIGTKPTDVFEIREEEVQYYLIDGRVWCDTEKKEGVVRKQIKQMVVG